jgi:ribonuclease BN (tRNA processing enzyme)
MLPEIGVLFDAGTSAFRVAERLKTGNVHIFLTHAHLDHVAGLTFFLTPLLMGQISRATVYGTSGTLRAVREHLFSEPIFPVEPTFEYVELPSRVPLPGGGVLTHVPLVHPGGSLGYRIDWPDRSLAYITDTTADASRRYLDFIRGVDVLIHECYFPDNMADLAKKTGHSHTTQVAEVARAAEVGRLLLVHIDPLRPDNDPIGLATARAIFPNTAVAEDLMEIDF